EPPRSLTALTRVESSHKLPPSPTPKRRNSRQTAKSTHPYLKAVMWRERMLDGLRQAKNTIEIMRPEHSNLTLDEVHSVLARNNTGRVAYSRGTCIDIEPVAYVYSEGWLYGRTSTKRRLAAATGESWWPVAFEVDEIKGLFDWRS